MLRTWEKLRGAGLMGWAARVLTAAEAAAWAAGERATRMPSSRSAARKVAKPAAGGATMCVWFLICLQTVGPGPA